MAQVTKRANLLRIELRNGAVPVLFSSSVISLKLLLLSLYTSYVLTMLAFFLRACLLMVNDQLKLPGTTSSQLHAEAGKREHFSFNCSFLLGRENFEKIPSRLPNGYL